MWNLLLGLCQSVGDDLADLRVLNISEHVSWEVGGSRRRGGGSGWLGLGGGSLRLRLSLEFINIGGNNAAVRAGSGNLGVIEAFLLGQLLGKRADEHSVATI